MKSDFAMRKLTVCGTKNGGRCIEPFKPRIELYLNKEVKMSFKARQLAGTALVISLFIRMHIATDGYASRGTKIAFTCTRGGNLDICVMDGDGDNEIRLTEDYARDFEPSWSPDGDRIAFVSTRDRNHQHIFVMDSDGRNLTQLTEEGANKDPAWSPDGRRIAFNHHKGEDMDIYAMDPDGKNQTQLTQIGLNYHPAWSHDGVRIAYVNTLRQGGPEIYAMDSDGSNEERLTHDLAEKDNPSWSPDGQRIAYDVYRGGVYQIHAVKTDGSGLTRRLTRNRPNKSGPAWSPDGDTIAYALWEPGVFTTINLMTPDGKHLAQLSEGDGTFRTDPDWFDPVGRSVSPDANYLTIWGKVKEPTSSR